jgi:predicted dehydrogenase
MQTIRYGVIGVGGWGERHVEVFQDHSFGEVVAVCDVSPERAREVAEKHGVPHAFSDYRELLAIEDIDAVSVVTPDFAHTEPVLAAIEAGKDLLVEKPLATTVSEAEQIRDAANAKGIRLMVDFHNRWSPPFFKARESIQEGDVGKVRYVYYRLSDVQWVAREMLSWASKTTVSWFLGSHCVDTLLWLLDDDIVRIHSLSRQEVLRGQGIDTPDFVVSILEFRGGAVATLETAWILPDGCPTIIDLKCEILGDQGSLLIDASHHGTLRKNTHKGSKFPDTMVLPTIHGRPSGLAMESIRYFADCMAKDETPMVNAEDGVRVTKVVAAIEKSRTEGKTIELADV